MSAAHHSFVLGLVGSGISASLTPALQEREGHASGLSLTYRLIDTDRLGLGPADLPDVLAWTRRLGFDGLNITHPFKQAVVPLLDGLSDDARDLGAVNTVLFRDGRMLGRNTDWSGYSHAFRSALPDAVRDGVVLVGAGGAGVAVGYGLLRQGAAHVAVHDTEEHRARWCTERLARRFGQARVSVAHDVAEAIDDAGGVVNATPVGMSGHPGSPVRAICCAGTSGSATSSTSRSRPTSSRQPVPTDAGCCPAAGWPSTRPSARSSTSPAGCPTSRG